jgi:hypothetical protein
MLGLSNLTISHTGENVSTIIKEVLNEFKLIVNNKVRYIILDNTLNNDQAVETLGPIL